MSQATAPPPSVFISYRRDDSLGHAGRLYDHLAAHFKDKVQVFMDVDVIRPGEDFVRHIEDAVGSCDLLLAVIGRRWFSVAGEATRRLDDPDDFVRLEIESALASPRVKVLPVLVEGAEMPRAADLPESIRPLARLNAMELDDRRWTADLRRLSATVETLTQRPDPASTVAHGSPRPRPARRPRPRRRRRF